MRIGQQSEGYPSITHIDWFDLHLSEQQQRALREASTTVRYHRRETLVKRGEFVTHLIYLQSGYVKVEVESGAKTLILDIVPPRHMLGLPVALTLEKHPFTIIALSDVDAVFFPLAQVCAVLEENGQSLLAATHYSNSTFVLPLIEKMQSISLNSIRGRLAKLLLQLSVRVHSSKRFTLLLTRYELAQMIGFSRENVIRILSEFHAEGLVAVNGKQIEILNTHRLEELARYS